MSSGRTALLLAVIMALVATTAVGIAAGLLYRADLDAQAARLRDLVASQVELIEAMARHDARVQPVEGFGSGEAATMAQLRAANESRPGLGETGEFTLSKRRGERIEFLLSLRYDGQAGESTSVPWASPLAEPARRALRGETGTTVGKDYRGVEVLAAYAPVPFLDMGLVAKIDLEEILAPFLRAILVALLALVLLVAAGTVLYLRIVNPLVRDKLASEARLRSIVEDLADGLLVVDGGGRVVFANAAAAHLFGRGRDQLVGLHFGEAAIAEDFCNVDILPASGGPRIAEVRSVEVEWNGQPARILSLRDVTERERVANELHRQHELLQTVLDNIPAMVSWRDRDLIYRGANPEFARATGHDPPERVIGLTDADMPWTAEEAELKRLKCLAVIDAGAAMQSGEETRHLRDGTEAVVIASNAPLRDRDGRITGVLVVEVDITELKETQYNLQQAQKMEAIGKLTGGIAHDFNNLLGVVLGNLQLIERFLAREAVDPEGRITQRLETAMNAVTRGAELTRRLLAFSRRQMLEPRVLDLNELAQGMEELLTRTLGETISVRFVPAPDLWPVSLDPGQAENALLNLAINARDAMPAGGTLTIETANVVLDADYAGRHKYVTPGEFALLAVSDSGTGMSEQVRAQVFEPFFTTKEAGRGTGLGLSMVYGFVKQSAGHVNIYSEEGVGTTVKIYFPRQRGAVETPAQDAPAGDLRGGDETLLVVEDDEALRATVAEYLRSMGYTVKEAVGGPEALAVLDGDPDVALLFTDVVIPGGINGAELWDRARARRPDLRVLYASGYARDALSAIHRDVIAEKLMSKPYRLEDLARRIRESLDAA